MLGLWLPECPDFLARFDSILHIIKDVPEGANVFHDPRRRDANFIQYFRLANVRLSFTKRSMKFHRIRLYMRHFSDNL